MSSTNRGATRMADDWYESPPFAIRAILAELGPIPPSRILEPTAGRGAIVRELMTHWPLSSITALEIDPTRFEMLKRMNTAGPSYCVDYLESGVCAEKHYDLGITNPPFDLAVKVIVKTIHLCRETVMLARLNFLASMERYEFWRAYPADVYVLPRRPSFCASLKCGGKPKCAWHETIYLDAPRPEKCPGCGEKIQVTTTDSCEYSFMVWGPGRGGKWKRLECEQGRNVSNELL